MKKIFLFILWFAYSLNSNAQSFNDGYKMMQYHRYASAIKIFNDLVAQRKDDTLSAYWLALAYIKNKDTLHALKTSNDEISINPNSTLLQIGLANAYALSNNKAKAQELLSSQNLSPGNINSDIIANAVGRCLTDMEEYQEAQKYYSKAVVINPSNKSTYILLGQNSASNGNGGAAYKYYDKALTIDSNYAPAYFYKAKLFISQNNPTVYLPLLKKIIAKDSAFAPAWYELYRYAYYHNKDKAKDYFTHYLNTADKTEEQKLRLLILSYGEKKYKKTIDIANQLLKTGYNLPANAYKYLAFSYYKANDIDNAYNNMHTYMQLQDSNKISSTDMYLIAQYAARQKSLDSISAGYIWRAFDVDTNAVNRKFYAGTLMSYYNTKNNQYQVNNWKEKMLPYLTSNKKTEMYKTGVAWYNMKEYHRADSLFEQYRQLYPDDCNGIYMQAGIKASLDSNMQNEMAVTYFKDFLTKAGNKIYTDYKEEAKQSYNYIASYYLKKENYQQALKYYTALLKIIPGNRAIKKTIMNIKRYDKALTDSNEKKINFYLINKNLKTCIVSKH